MTVKLFADEIDRLCFENMSRYENDIIVRIFRQVHFLASHSPLSKKWKVAEKRLKQRYCPDLFKMIQLGIKRERI